MNQKFNQPKKKEGIFTNSSFAYDSSTGQKQCQVLAAFLTMKSSPSVGKLVCLSVDLDDEDQSFTEDFPTF